MPHCHTILDKINQYIWKWKAFQWTKKCSRTAVATVNSHSEHLFKVMTTKIDQIPAHWKRIILSTEEKVFMKNARQINYLKVINNRRRKVNKESTKLTVKLWVQPAQKTLSVDILLRKKNSQPINTANLKTVFYRVRTSTEENCQVVIVKQNCRSTLIIDMIICFKWSSSTNYITIDISNPFKTMKRLGRIFLQK